MPAGGAERTIDVVLERDPAAGSLSVRVVDLEGHDLTPSADDTIVSVRRTDGPMRPPRGVSRDGTLAFDGLPAGRYEVFATDRRFGAATVTTTIEGGHESRAEVRLSPPASVVVRIHAGPRRRVQFQLFRTGTAVPAFEDPVPKAAPGVPVAESSRVYFLAGSEGTRIRGLSAGRYVVHVVSADLAAPDTVVDVGTGGAAEVEIRTTAR